MSILYSKRFAGPWTERQVLHAIASAGNQIAMAAGSQNADLSDPNLRHEFVTVPLTATNFGDGTYCLSLRVGAAADVQESGNAFVVIDSNTVLTSYELWSSRVRLYSHTENIPTGTSYITLFPQRYDNIREIYACAAMKVGDFFSCRFMGLCDMERIPRDPNSVKTEHKRLGIRSEFPGQQFHQEGLGTYREITMTWERLGADDLAALDEAYHTVPTLEAPVVLYDDTDPQGAAYGRFISFDWSSGAFELTYDAKMVFEEIVIPS